MSNSNVLHFRRKPRRPRGGVIVLEPSPYVEGWWCAMQIVNGQRLLVGVGTDYDIARIGGARLAREVGAKFCPIGVPAGGKT